MLALAHVLTLPLRVDRRAAILIIPIVLIFGGRAFRGTQGTDALGQWRGEHRYVSVGRLVRELTPPGSAVLAMQHSGSVRYYGGRVTVRHDLLEGEWLDRAVDWLGAKGAHPYLVVEAFELPKLRARFAGQATLARLDAAPVAVYTGPSTVYLFDLRPGGGEAPPTVVFFEAFDGPFCFSPMPRPYLGTASTAISAIDQ
jgi:hypothetical protein